MGLSEEFERPRNAALVTLLVLGAGALLARCGGKDDETFKEPLPLIANSTEPQNKEENEEALERFGSAVRALLEADAEPRVVFDQNAEPSMYEVEQGLSDCIQMQENTCYLRSDLSSMFRTRLECFGNDWEEFSEPLGITFGSNYFDGARAVIHTPDGGSIPYENAPHPRLDAQAASDFYTELCRDVLAIMEEPPVTNPCLDADQPEACLDRGSSSEWAYELESAFEESFVLLKEHGFDVKDDGMNFLSVGFEGARRPQNFFPKKTYCLNDEGVNPCWKFELVFGGEYTPDELLEQALDMQVALDEGEEL